MAASENQVVEIFCHEASASICSHKEAAHPVFSPTLPALSLMHQKLHRLYSVDTSPGRPTRSLSKPIWPEHSRTCTDRIPCRSRASTRTSSAHCQHRKAARTSRCVGSASSTADRLESRRSTDTMMSGREKARQMGPETGRSVRGLQLGGTWTWAQTRSPFGGKSINFLQKCTGYTSVIFLQAIPYHLAMDVFSKPSANTQAWTTYHGGATMQIVWTGGGHWGHVIPAPRNACLYTSFAINYLPTSCLSTPHVGSVYEAAIHVHAIAVSRKYWHFNYYVVCFG